MKNPIFTILFFAAALLVTVPLLQAEEVSQPKYQWPMDDHAGLAIQGNVTSAAGIAGESLVFEGESLATVKDSANYTDLADGYTIAFWVCPFFMNSDQQMLVGKNRYSLDQREWGVMIDRDRQLRAYLWQNGWKTIEAATPLEIDAWSLVGLVVQKDSVQLWVNGALAAETDLKHPIPTTDAPLTIGGIDDHGKLRQHFLGAVDEVHFYTRPIEKQEWSELHQQVAISSELQQIAKATQAKAAKKWAHLLPVENPVKMWDETQTLRTAESLPVLKEVSFHVIKPYEVKKDGYRFLHGVALVWHKDKLYASFGHNQGAENTVTEEARYCVSEDGGKSWSDLMMIDPGTEELAVSHGVFHSTGDQLWAFQGSYHGLRKGLRTRAYLLNETSGKWEFQGTILSGGFWPINPPVKMDDGNWIMPGLIVGNGNHTAVAISHGDSMMQWDLVPIPVHSSVGKMWGESAILVDGSRITNICRYGAKAQALAATSDDYGRTWTPMQDSNLPMVTSKPFAGTLTNGQNYLIATTTSNSGGKRYPLTIALSRPDEDLFSQVFVIRHAKFEQGPGESHPHASLSYPYAIEHEGKLYVGYSNNGGKVDGRAGNDNSAEMAIIPLSQLTTK
ncbi:exo-alpha-sialidase [Bremerella alba]|uniref:LamG-like jellyroll fold domain-containing protein n=1 Tax=Bremerella alba TaxID=980252 RepID=A0A7V9A609_9BACT|nr:exo-alpha-sialidase [Bremerella alba]MBA2113783.1 hypothetical protein [Bremerella alba]